MSDVARIVIIFEAGFSLTITAAILWVYFGRVPLSGAALLSKHIHIVSVAVVYLLLSVYAMVEIYGRIGTRFTWRIPYLFTAFAVGNLAQFSLLMFERRMTRLRLAQEEDCG